MTSNMWNQARGESNPSSPVQDPIEDSEAFEFQHQRSQPWSDVKSRGITSIFKNRKILTILVGVVLCFAVVIYLSSSSSQLPTPITQATTSKGQDTTGTSGKKEPEVGNTPKQGDTTGTDSSNKDGSPAGDTSKKDDTAATDTSKKDDPTAVDTSKKDNPTTVDTPKRDPIPSDAYADESYVALCLSVGQQAKDLPEFFIHHYHHLGIRRFYIMDDATVPPLSETQDYGIPREAITFVYYTLEDRAKVQFMQPHLYSECHRLFGDRHVWIGFIDVDEFLEMRTKEENFYQFLKSYDDQKDVGAVGVQWFVHTASNIQTRQPSCRKAFTTCVAENHDENKSIKSIVKMKFFVKPTSPHSFETIPGTRTVGEHGDTVPFANRIPQSHDRIALHHYTLKSREEYQEKMNRDNGMHDHGRTWDLWNKIENEYPHVECKSMAEYNP